MPRNPILQLIPLVTHASIPILHVPVGRLKAGRDGLVDILVLQPVRVLAHPREHGGGVMIYL